jgi:transmembrane sensor
MNEPQHMITKDMVFAYFGHMATPMERQQIESWIKTKEGLETYFTYLDEWERQFPQFQAKFEDAHSKFTSYMQGVNQDDVPAAGDAAFQPTPASSARGKIFGFRVDYWLAASVVSLLLAGMWFSREQWYYQTWNSKSHALRTIQLSDGSEVELGANSSLKYPRFGFDWGTRHVWLNGDAEFKVAHLENGERFKVLTPDQTVIEVLGTEFVVTSRPKVTMVMLKTGSILLTNPVADQQVILKPGDLITISPGKGMQKERIGEMSDNLNWRSQQFTFNDTPLKDVALQLYDAYGVKVNIKESTVLNRTISGTFEAETAKDLLDAISAMMKLEVEQTTEGYELRLRNK